MKVSIGKEEIFDSTSNNRCKAVFDPFKRIDFANEALLSKIG